MNIIPRICFFLYGLPPEYSGASIYTIELSKLLLQRGVKIIFLTYTYCKKLLKENEYEGIKVIKFLRDKNYNLFKYHLNLLLKLFSNRNEYDIIYINGLDGQFWTSFYIIIFSLFFSKQVILELNMDSYVNEPLGIKGTSFEKLKWVIARKAFKYITRSTALTKNLEKTNIPRDKILQLYYSVNLERFKMASSIEEKIELRKKLNLPINKKILTSCGAIIKRKGITFLIETFYLIKEKYKEVILVLVGPYDLFEMSDKNFVNSVFNLVEKLNLKEDVIFTGLVNNTYEYMKASDIFVFAGRQEGSPNVIREAMASGLPVISLNLKDVTSDMIDNGKDGFIIDVKDEEEFKDWANKEITDSYAKEEFANTALKLLTDEELRKNVGHLARKKMEEKFSMVKYLDDFMDLLYDCYRKG